MGLKKAIGDRFGNANANAHIEIAEVRILPLASEARIITAIWKDKPAQSTDDPFEQDTITATGTNFTDNFSKTELLKPGNHPVKAAETYLKTLAKFSGASDEA